VRPERRTAVAALATVLVAALGAAAIAGCDGARRSEAPAGAAGAADTAEGGAGGPGAVRSSGPASTAGAAAPLPADTGDAEAAAAVIRSYYDAIARRDYASAYRLWAGQGAASGQSYEEFRRGYAETAAVEVAIGEPGRVEGAAGSRYVQVPVEIRARTTAGADQCFRGTYTLVRSVVPGATAEQRRWRIHSAAIARCGPGADGPGGAGGLGEAGERAAVIAVVERFGERLARVSPLAPVETARQEVRREYGPLVTASLLEAWLADPSAAPGRRVSSPWPARIEVGSVRRTGPGAYEVVGSVVYVTSAEAAAGGGEAARAGVVLAVVQDGAGAWRIARYRE